MSSSIARDRSVLWPRPEVGGGHLPVRCEKRAVVNRLFALVEPACSVAGNGPRCRGGFKRGGGGTVLDTACDVRGRRAHVGVVLIHPTKLDASNCPHS